MPEVPPPAGTGAFPKAVAGAEPGGEDGVGGMGPPGAPLGTGVQGSAGLRSGGRARREGVEATAASISPPAATASQGSAASTTGRLKRSTRLWRMKGMRQLPPTIRILPRFEPSTLASVSICSHRPRLSSTIGAIIELK